ncbi:MAG: phospho-N-acetylmuramoyl-pentapeptide-transferase, partial [Candidatus Marinamargulisbacteria bacterium]
GFLDDILAIMKGNNKGFSARAKFLIQVALGSACLVVLHVTLMRLTIWEAALSLFVIVGSSNATNLTDGLDGLLGGLLLFSLLGFYGYFFALSLPVNQVFCLVFIISISAFIWFNRNPAQIFMGDTGSLGLGALLAGLAIISGEVLIILPLGAVYIIETLSVIIQVAYFKVSGKRVFLMAPLHHHFELMGFSERKTVLLFWSIGAAFLCIFVVRLGLI